jgi:acyl carrier protein
MIQQTEAEVVRQILETALDTSLAGIADPARGGLENWDSLTHMEIVFMLEDAFGVRFDEDEIAELDSESQIVECVRRKHG